MEIIQWYSSGATKPGVLIDRNKATKHCLFRLDELDKELIDPETLKYIKNESAREAAEFNLRPDKTLSLRISEDDNEEYKLKLLGSFALLIGILKPGESFAEYIRKF